MSGQRPGSEDDLSSESVEVLRERLTTMKKLMAQKQSENSSSKAEDIFVTNTRIRNSIIDGNFLSLAFGSALIVIISVSIYAFYHLYHAILKKFPSAHTEL